MAVIGFNDFVIPQTKCAECGAPADRLTGVIAPSPGDMSLCVICGSLSAVADDLTLRQPTLDEYLEVAADNEIQKLRKTILDCKAKNDKPR